MIFNFFKYVLMSLFIFENWSFDLNVPSVCRLMNIAISVSVQWDEGVALSITRLKLVHVMHIFLTHSVLQQDNESGGDSYH